MDQAELTSAWIGLLGVAVGAFVTLLGSVVVPWVRDSLDRRRREKVEREREIRDCLLAALAALLTYRQQKTSPSGDSGAALAEFGAARNALSVRLTAADEPVLDVLMVMLAMIQESRPGIEYLIGEAMEVLTLWARGEVKTEDVISEVERRARVKFSPDRSNVSLAP